MVSYYTFRCSTAHTESYHVCLSAWADQSTTSHAYYTLFQEHQLGIDCDDDNNHNSNSTPMTMTTTTTTTKSQWPIAFQHCQYLLIGRTCFNISNGHKKLMPYYMSKCICPTSKYWLCGINSLLLLLLYHCVYSLWCITMHGVGVIILDRTALLPWTLSYLMLNKNNKRLSYVY